MSNKIFITRYFLCPFCEYKHSAGMIIFTEKCVSCHKVVDTAAWKEMTVTKEIDNE